MFLDKPYVVFAQALADSLLLHIAKHAVFEELGPNPFARRMIAGLARRLHGLVRDVEAYTLRSGQERIIGYLLAELPEGAAQGVCRGAPHAGQKRSRLAAQHDARALLPHPARARRRRADRSERPLDPRPRCGAAARRIGDSAIQVALPLSPARS